MNRAFLPPTLSAERVVACCGLISDTHMPKRWRELPPAVFDVLQGVDLVLHAGDVGELWVLDQLSTIAPTLAVHGNDETEEAQRELPYQQVLAVGGHRLFLCHGHLPDRRAEVVSRAGDEWRPKLAQRARQAREAGASVMVFGHLHIPFACRAEGLWLVNPGAIASGSAFTRQTRQTVALLFLRDDGRPFVTHVDLACPDRPFAATVDWDAGFGAAHSRYNETIADAAVARVVAALRETPFYFDRRLWRAFSRPGMSRWLRRTDELITVAELRDELAVDNAFTAAERDALFAVFARVDE